ncbi:hypothetical protein HPIN_00810 [Helicobacter pylori India7]|uniref:Uncharacterized protein n=1 Tax=Helicobacter pylori (strain India7) TaxID=907238 RepID=E8QE31_HELP7|nr:hypothetical protein HPIN_00810 [Helicobacter pylori India7]
MLLETITLANIYEEQGFFEEALQIYTNILKKTPDHTEALKQMKRLEKIQKKSRSFQTRCNIRAALFKFYQRGFFER